jgi:peroxiredoxin
MRPLLTSLLALFALSSSLTAFEEPAPPTPKQLYESLQKEFEASRAVLAKAQEQSKPELERRVIVAHYRSSVHGLAGRAMKLAAEHPTDPTAIDALVWVVDELSLKPETTAAWTMLARDFIGDEGLVEACRSTGTASHSDFEAVEAFLRAAMNKSPHRRVRGFASYYLAEHLKGRIGIIERLDSHPEETEAFGKDYDLDAEELALLRKRNVDDLAREAKGLYEQTIASYGDLATRRTVSLGELAKGELFDLTSLSVGKQAPDIVGRDVDGKPLKLSDYRGKVVVLTFSGNWCPGCVGMYPHERRMVERLKDLPFALLSVTTDEDVKTLQAAKASGEITWRCWWDGTNGPISIQWGINEFPSIFVVDATGVIRYKKVRGEQLDEAVDSLLKSMGPEHEPASDLSK